MKTHTTTWWERNAPEILGLIVLALLILFGFGLTGNAQTLSPVISECGRKCSGTFTVTNNGVVPLAVIIEPYSFSLDPATGKSKLRTLDASTEVDLDEMSARLGPHEAHEFGYRIKCAQFPCLVTFYASMIAGRTPNGTAMRLMLPTVVYQCAKERNCRRDVRQAAGLK